MKTPEELNALKEEVKAPNAKLAELTDEELAEVSGGLDYSCFNLPPVPETMSSTDMGKEMATFAKNNILTQTAQSELAQANQLPQGILSLLQ